MFILLSAPMVYANHSDPCLAVGEYSKNDIHVTEFDGVVCASVYQRGIGGPQREVNHGAYLYSECKVCLEHSGLCIIDS